MYQQGSHLDLAGVLGANVDCGFEIDLAGGTDKDGRDNEDGRDDETGVDFDVSIRRCVGLSANGGDGL